MEYLIVLLSLVILGLIIYIFFQVLVIMDLRTENELLNSHLNREEKKDVPDTIFQLNECSQQYLSILSGINKSIANG